VYCSPKVQKVCSDYTSAGIDVLFRKARRAYTERPAPYLIDMGPDVAQVL